MGIWKMIFVVPLGGLCNRMRCINSVYRLFGKSHKIIVLWAINDECAIASKKLFSLPNEIKIFDFSHYNFIERRLWSVVFRLCRSVSDKLLTEEKDISEIRGDKAAVEKAFSYKRVFFVSGSDLLLYQPCECFSPRPDIVAAVEKITGADGEYDSMHIRRTDNKWSIEMSSEDAFEQILQEAENNKRKIFLATDDLGLKEKFIKKYPNTIFSSENVPLNRNTAEGMKAAYVDLLCLAGGKKIYGSYFSSFTDVASCIYGASLEVVKKED